MKLARKKKAFCLTSFSALFFPTKTSDLVGLHRDIVNSDQLMEISTSHDKVKDILSKLDVNIVTGVVGIPERIVK